jgi:nucleoid-associated protein YgaU
MTVPQGSRYFGQPVIPVVTTSGSAQAVFGPPATAMPGFVFYRVVSGDRFDTISAALYGVPDYWWRIARVNPEIFYPDQLTPGIILRIPTT